MLSISCRCPSLLPRDHGGPGGGGGFEKAADDNFIAILIAVRAQIGAHLPCAMLLHPDGHVMAGAVAGGTLVQPMAFGPAQAAIGRHARRVRLPGADVLAGIG